VAIEILHRRQSFFLCRFAIGKKIDNEFYCGPVMPHLLMAEDATDQGRSKICWSECDTCFGVHIKTSLTIKICAG